MFFELRLLGSFLIAGLVLEPVPDDGRLPNMVRSKKLPPQTSTLAQSVLNHQQEESSLRAELGQLVGPTHPDRVASDDDVREIPSSARLIDGYHRLMLEQPSFTYTQIEVRPAIAASGAGANAGANGYVDPTSNLLTYLSFGSAEVPLELPKQTEALSASLGEKKFIALKILLARKCDTKAASSLFRSNSSADARAAADYLFGQIAAARSFFRTRDPVAHQTLFRWLAQLIEAGYTPAQKITEYGGTDTPRILPSDLVVSKFADPQILRLITEKGKLPHPLVSVLKRRNLPARIAPVGNPEFFALTRSLQVCARTKHLSARLVSDADECAAILRQWLLRSLEGTTNSLQAHAHQTQLFVAIQEDRADWFDAWLPVFRTLIDDQSSLEGFLTTAILVGSLSATEACIKAGIDPQSRYENYTYTSVDKKTLRKHTLASMGVLHQGISSPLETASERHRLIDLLVASGASPMSLAKLRNEGEGATEVQAPVNTVIHALRENNIDLAKRLLHAQKNSRALRQKALDKRLAEERRTLAEVRATRGEAGADASLSLFFSLRHCLSELTFNYGFGLESSAESNFVRDLLALSAWAFELEQSPSHRGEKVSESSERDSVSAADIGRAAFLMGVVADDVRTWPDLPAFFSRIDKLLAEVQDSLTPTLPRKISAAPEELKDAIDSIDAFGGPLRSIALGPLTALTMGLADDLLRSYLSLPVRVLPQDLVQAFVWLHATTANSSHSPNMREAQARRKIGQAFVEAATQPEALLALLHAAVRLAQPKLVQTLLRQDRINHVSFTSCTGIHRDKLAFLFTEGATSGLPALFKACPDKAVRSSWLAYCDEGGDTAFHVAARSSLQALKILLEQKPRKDEPLTVMNAFGVTPFQESVHFAQTETIIYLLDTYPHLCLPQLHFDIISRLPSETLLTVLRAVAKLGEVEAWSNDHLEPLLAHLRFSDLATASAAERIFREKKSVPPLAEKANAEDIKLATNARSSTRITPAVASSRPVGLPPPGPKPARAPELQKMWTATSATQRALLIDEFIRHCTNEGFVPGHSASSSVTTRAWALIDALHITSRGQGMGRHFVAHRPETSLSALRERASNRRLQGASRFGANDALELLFLWRDAQRLMQSVAAERLACFVVELSSPGLRGDGVLYGAGSGDGLYYRDSRVVRFVMRWADQENNVDFVAVYPVPEKGKKSIGQLRRV